MKSKSKALLTIVVFLVILSSPHFANAKILFWDTFEQGTPTAWIMGVHGSGNVSIVSETSLIFRVERCTSYDRQRHGELSLRLEDLDGMSWINANRVFPELPPNENEFMVEFYFFLSSSDIALNDLSLYRPTRGGNPANIAVVLNATFDSTQKRYWRIKVKDNTGSHFVTIPESLRYWHRFQIHQLETGTVNLWIDGDSIGSYISSSGTQPPDLISIGTFADEENGTGFWDDFIVTTPPRNANHPRIYFSSDMIPELQSRMTDNNPTPIGQSYQQIYNRRRDYVNLNSHSSIPDQGGETLTYPYHQPAAWRTPTALVSWDQIGLRIDRRFEIIAFVATLENRQGLFDTLRFSLRAVSNWQQWVNPFDTAVAWSTKYHPTVYIAHVCAFITRGMSQAYDLIFDRLNNYERMSIQNSILVLGVGQLYLGLKLGCEIGKEGWYWGNWGALYSSALGIACMALDDEETFSPYLDFLFHQYLPKLISSNPSDPSPFFDSLGMYDEGVQYGSYTMSSLVRLAEVNKNVRGDISLFQEPHFKEYINGLIHSLISGWGHDVPFGDVPNNSEFWVVIPDGFYFLTKYYQSTIGQWLISKSIVNDSRYLYDGFNGYGGYGWITSYIPQFVHLDANLQVTHPKDILSTSRYFSTVGVVTARNDWSDTSLVAAIKCGPGYAGHGYHKANGTFVLGRNNQWLIDEYGYDRNPQSRTHSVLTVDGQGQIESLPKGHITTFDTSYANSHFIYFEVDPSHSYSYSYNGHPLLKKWIRCCVLFKNPSCFVTFDNIKSDVPRQLDWRLRPSYGDRYFGGDTIYLSIGNDNLYVKFLLPLQPNIQWDGTNSVFVVNPNIHNDVVTEAQYLTVYLPCANIANRPHTARIDGSTMVGAQVKNEIIMFSRMNNYIYKTEFTIENSAPDTDNVNLVNLLPSTFYFAVIKDESGVITSSEFLLGSPQGSLSFKVYAEGLRHITLNSVEDLVDAQGTYPNQGRHLSRQVNSREFQFTYQGMQNVFWRLIGENVIMPQEYLDGGLYPSIGVDPQGQPWVSYTKDNELCTQIKTDNIIPGTWRKTSIAFAPKIGPPSLHLSMVRNVPGLGDMGYVVYQELIGTTSFIHFTAFDSVVVYYDTILDSGNVAEPSIAITPKDLLHIVWRNANTIYYITTLEGITPLYIRNGTRPKWSTKMPISKPITNSLDKNEPVTGGVEPASNPFVETQGEYVYVVWRGPNEMSNPALGEIWQKTGRILPGHLPMWGQAMNKSQTPNQESNYPTMSTQKVVVWQEALPSNNEIFANINGSILNLSNTLNNSFYPHANLAPGFPPDRYNWQLFTIWTEESIPGSAYKIKYSYYHFGFEPPVAILDVVCGEPTPSPYCLKRDGYYATGTVKVDFGQELIYQICYLHPKKHYVVQVTAYPEIPVGPILPAILNYTIPYGTYDSTTFILNIQQTFGSYHAVANIQLFEYEELGGDKGEQDLTFGKITRTFLNSPFPNPSNQKMTIRYQLAKTSEVSLKAYNSMGKLVKTLVDGKKEMGVYKVNFESTDSRGKKLPLGIYFIHLKTEDYQETRKAILVK